MNIKIVEGDLLGQEVEVIVNAWNRNIIPWWLLLPQGVSGAIKYRAGLEPFRELAGKGPIPLGGAVETRAGKLPFRAIIHVAGINMLWRSSEGTIRACVRSALALAQRRGYRSVAFPLIGAGTGGFAPGRALEVMSDEVRKASFDGEVRLVKYKSRMNARGCYCGFCEKCGKPGHTRHFPGAAPYTGTRCDYHYRMVAILHPMGFPGTFIYAAIALCLYLFLK